MSMSDIHLADRLIEDSKLTNLKILYLHGHSEMGITKMKDFLPDLLQITTEQIYIDSFKLGEQDLNIIFKHSVKVKHLCLINWEVTNIGEDFVIPETLKYKVQTLDLFWTWCQYKEGFLDERKLKALLKEIKDSQLDDR